MDAAGMSQVAQIPPHPARAVGAIALGEAGSNRRRQLRMALRAGALGGGGFSGASAASSAFIRPRPGNACAWSARAFRAQRLMTLA